MLSKSSRRNWIVFSSVMLLSVGTAAAWLQFVELVDANILLTVRHSVQFAYPFFLLVLIARPLQQLLRKPWTAKLLRKRRLLGVAFAGAMTAHMLLIFFRFNYTPEVSRPAADLLLGGSVYAIMYLMFITSFDSPTRALGPKRWKFLHRTGLIAATIVFIAPSSIADFTNFQYLKFLVPMLLALAIRFAAWRQSSRQGS